MVIDGKILALTEILLFALCDNIDRGTDGDVDLGDVRRHLELNLVLFLVSQLNVLITLGDSDVIHFIDCLQRDFSLLKKSQICHLPIVEN